MLMMAPPSAVEPPANPVRFTFVAASAFTKPLYRTEMIPLDTPPMKSLRSILGAIARCKAGTTSVEYGLIAFVIAVTITATTAQTGKSIRGVFADITKAMDGPANEPARQFP